MTVPPDPKTQTALFRVAALTVIVVLLSVCALFLMLVVKTGVALFG